MSKDNIELKDVLHYYLGCDIELMHDSGSIEKLEAGNYNHFRDALVYLTDLGSKLILRKLDSMADEDIKPMPFKQYPDFENKKFTPDQFLYLLSKGFDLFNLIENNLAIDKKAKAMTTNQGAIFIKSFSEKLIREKVMMEKPSNFDNYTNGFPEGAFFESELKVFDEYKKHIASRRTFPYDVKEEQDGKEIREGKDFKLKRVDQRENSNDVPEWQTIAVPIEPEKKEDNRISICEKISEDAKNDASAFDWTPFNGRKLATYLGYHGASIAALAELVKSILEENAKK
jgi:hypothetical protein